MSRKGRDHCEPEITKHGKAAVIANWKQQKHGKAAVIANRITTKHRKGAVIANRITTKHGKAAVIANRITTIKHGKAAVIANRIKKYPLLLLKTNRFKSSFINWCLYSSRSISAGLPISYCLHVKSRFSQRPPGVASHPGSL